MTDAKGQVVKLIIINIGHLQSSEHGADRLPAFYLLHLLLFPLSSPVSKAALDLSSPSDDWEIASVSHASRALGRCRSRNATIRRQPFTGYRCGPVLVLGQREALVDLRSH